MKRLLLVVALVSLAGCGDPNYVEPPTKTIIHYVPEFNNISSSKP